VLFFLAVFCVCSIPLFLHYIHIIKNPGIFEFPVAGMMANKNAFIFLFLSFFCLSNLMPRDRFWGKAALIFWALAPFAYALTFARAGLLIFPLLILFLWLLKANISWKKCLLILAISSSFLLAFNWMGNNTILGISPVDGLTSSRNDVLKDVKTIITFPTALVKEEAKFPDINYKGDRLRIAIIQTSLEAIKDHPVIGAGLGSASIYQQQKWGKFVNIDCTPLWLWAETGLIGLIAFLGFYFTCLIKLWKNSAKTSFDPYVRSVLKAVLMIMIVFGGMCLLHEILYTRFLWLFMGMGIGLPLTQARHQD
jgi:O-antigen ligase